jgi:hypothetical protein
MSHLEPTYLRYIYDGLLKGSIHPENAEELTDGLKNSLIFFLQCSLF